MDTREGGNTHDFLEKVLCSSGRIGRRLENEGLNLELVTLFQLSRRILMIRQ